MLDSHDLEAQLLHMNPSAGHSLESAGKMLEDLLDLEHSHSTDQVEMVPADLLETPCVAPACWADPAELVEVEDASMSLDLEVLGLVWEGLRYGKTRFGMIIAALPQVRSPQQIQKPYPFGLVKRTKGFIFAITSRCIDCPYLSNHPQ